MAKAKKAKMRKGTCHTVGVGKRCECRAKNGVVSFRSGAACGGKKRAKRSKSKNCHMTPKGHCLCKTPSGGHTWAKKSRCGR